MEYRFRTNWLKFQVMTNVPSVLKQEKTIRFCTACCEKTEVIGFHRDIPVPCPKCGKIMEMDISELTKSCDKCNDRDFIVVYDSKMKWRKIICKSCGLISKRFNDLTDEDLRSMIKN